jgi:2-C-methyl-D-erythritol 4-phosphate cytidylyltransferase
MKNAAPQLAPLALIAAGGEGKRLGSNGPKALVVSAGRTLLAWCLDGFAASESFGNGAGLVIVAAHASDVQAFEGAVAEAREAGLKVVVTSGGPSRSHSVAAALNAATLEHEPDRVVLVHDAARIHVSPALIDGLVAGLESDASIDALIAAKPVTDTIKRVDADQVVVETPNRSELWAVQTPQAFRARALAHALDVEDDQLANATDDASLVELSGGRVKMYPWSEPNPKITTPEDLVTAEGLLRSGV